MPPRPRLHQPAAPVLLLRRAAHSSSPGADAAPPPRWLTDLRARVGRCLAFGCTRAQTAGAAAPVLRALATEWRALTAGSEGFLTGGRRGLEAQQVVWGEQDSFQHVNNVTYIRYAEAARVNWARHFAVAAQTAAQRAAWAALMTPRAVGLIMKGIKCEFKFPLTYPDRVSVYHKLREPPAAASASLLLDVVVLSHRHGRVAARLEEDVVVYDYRAARKVEALPPFMRGVLAETFRLQEAERARARRRIWALVGAVEGLERATWDRPGAVEDAGGGAAGPA